MFNTGQTTNSGLNGQSLVKGVFDPNSKTKNEDVVWLREWIKKSSH